MSRHCGKAVTETYSTSFSAAVRLLHRDVRDAIYSIYGFVRIADEIVDTFHDYDQQALLADFRRDFQHAIERQLSLNPVLNGFQLTIRKYNIPLDLVTAFFNSMETDLYRERHDRDSYSEYIYGSAEVVGLMCLRVFCEGDEQEYQRLEPFARNLGAAFQKVNFLRDLGADYRGLDRSYFPGMIDGRLTEMSKRGIEEEIERDFQHALPGIRQLPDKARLGVYVAYKYYFSLFQKIQTVSSDRIAAQRIRVPNYRKWLILAGAGLRQQFKLI
jgi:phytoene/squalene synthetase